MADPKTLESLVRDMRRLIHLLVATADTLHAEAGITTQMRAMMETLDVDGPRTVPAVARARGVTRQHIQTLANTLVDMGLAEARDNPEHRRSPLIALTPAGDRALADIRTREAPLWKRYAARFDEDSLFAAANAVRAAADGLQQDLRTLKTIDAA